MSGSISSSSTRAGRAAGNAYYPPRSRGGTALREWWWRVVRTYHLPSAQILVPAGISPGWFLVSVAVPGFGFLAAGHPRVGLCAMAVSVVSAFVFLFTFGLPICWQVAAILMTVHIIGLAFLLRKSGAAGRLKSVLVAISLVGAIIYFPVYWGLSSLFLPLQVDGSAVIVRRQVPAVLKRGDWVALRMPSERADSIRMESGIWLVRLLGVPGDTVEFAGPSYRVNEESFRSLAYMPEKGRLVLGLAEWFVWPSLNIRNHGVGKTKVSEFLTGHSVISRDRILGIPCKTWLGRKQNGHESIQ